MSSRIRVSRALAVFVFGLAVLVLLVSGVWMGVRGSADVLGSDRVRGTAVVTGCGGVSACRASFTPDGGASADGKAAGAPRRVELSRIAASKKGERLDVALRKGTHEAVRTGTAGFVLAWVALGGALLLSALIVLSGLGLKRPAAGFALAGAVILVAAWLLR